MSSKQVVLAGRRKRREEREAQTDREEVRGSERRDWKRGDGEERKWKKERSEDEEEYCVKIQVSSQEMTAYFILLCFNTEFMTLKTKLLDGCFKDEFMILFLNMYIKLNRKVED